MQNATCTHLKSQFEIHRASIPALVSEDIVSLTLENLGITFRTRIFTPFVTLFAFLSQVLDGDRSCRRAVVEVAAVRRANGESSCSLKTTSFCRAKARLPVAFFAAIARWLGQKAEEQIVETWKWAHGNVKVVDGSAFSMPDTTKNLTVYPRHTSQRGNVGFPVARFLAVFSLASGALQDMAIAPYKGKGTGETTLLQGLWHCFSTGETLLGDALFSSYWIVATALQKEIHVVSELRAKSTWRLRKKQTDQTIHIEKPSKKPELLSQEDFAALPAVLTVRIIKICCAPKGFRPRVKFVLTTHLDRRIVKADDIAELYKRRWSVEVNLRSIKTILGMDVVRGRSPDMVEKEAWTYIMAYNVIRLKMVELGEVFRKVPHDISFRAVQQVLSVIRPLLATGTITASDMDAVLKLTITEVVGHRPDRYEPRATKRRPKNYVRLMVPRSQARQALHKKYKRSRNP